MELKGKVAKSLVAIGIVSSLVGGATFAWFTDSAANVDNVFTAGTLDVKLNESNGPVAYDFAVGSDLAPGDVVTTGTDGMAAFTISNDGSLPLVAFKKFNLIDDTDGLSRALYVKDLKVDWFKKDASTAWRTEHIITDGAFVDYATAFQGFADNDTTIEGSTNKLSLYEWVNSNEFNMGPWTMAALNPGEKVTMSFKLVFDENANDDFQGASLTGNYEVDARQANATALTAFQPAVDLNYVERELGIDL